MTDTRQHLELELLKAINARQLARIEHELAFEQVCEREGEFATAAERLRALIALEEGPS